MPRGPCGGGSHDDTSSPSPDAPGDRGVGGTSQTSSSTAASDGVAGDGCGVNVLASTTAVSLAPSCSPPPGIQLLLPPADAAAVAVSGDPDHAASVSTDLNDTTAGDAAVALLAARIDPANLIAQQDRVEAGEATHGDDECPICLDYIYDDDGLTTSCGHPYHYICLLRVFRVKKAYKCPYCTSDITGITPLHTGSFIPAVEIEKFLSRGAMNVVFSESSFYVDKKARNYRVTGEGKMQGEAIRLPPVKVQTVNAAGTPVSYAEPYGVRLCVSSPTRGVAIDESSQVIDGRACTGTFEHPAPAFRIDPAVFQQEKPLKILFTVTCDVGPNDLELGCEGAVLTQYVYLKAPERRRRHVKAATEGASGDKSSAQVHAANTAATAAASGGIVESKALSVVPSSSGRVGKAARGGHGGSCAKCCVIL